jgi:cytidine deaminase
MPLDALFEAARTAQGRAYAPYSGFRVGAAVVGESGAVYAGCNVENAAYPVGTCAEEAALAAMVGAGERRLASVLVIGDGPGFVTPCGACRQRIREFGGPDTPVHVADQGGVQRTFRLDDLLPFAFGPDNLPGKAGAGQA